MNMRQWIKDYIDMPVKKAMPILSFPGTQLIGKTVEEVVKDGYLQALCMETLAKKYNMGVAVSPMDLSVEAEAFGAEICFGRDEIPTVQGVLIHDAYEADSLKIPSLKEGRCQEYIRGIQIAKERVTDRPVFAGITGPYTLAARLLDMTEIMILCYEEPEMVETVLRKVTNFLITYAKAFKEAGADGIIMAEPAAGLLSPQLFEEFSTPYVKMVRDAVEEENFLFVYHNCGNITPIIQKVKETGALAYSVGNAIDIEEVLCELPEDVLVLGNMDPVAIFRNATTETVKRETKALLERCGKYPNFIISSGCDIPPQTPIENLDAFFEAVDEFYQ